MVPRPRRPAFSNVGGVPAATHIGGCGATNGLGRTFRGGIENHSPSCEYWCSRHIFGNSRMVSSHISLVVSLLGIPNPCCSVDDDPRPVQNSNRPPDSWSSMATRSATRAGWFTGGVVLKIAEPRCMVVVWAPTHARNTSGADMCEYSWRKWCSE